MSTAYNRRRGAKANKPRRVRLCLEPIPRLDGIVSSETYQMYQECGAAVSPNLNGNRCEEHRDHPH